MGGQHAWAVPAERGPSRASTATWASRASATSRSRSGSTGSRSAMGLDIGDIDNDGFLDIYLGTGGRPTRA